MKNKNYIITVTKIKELAQDIKEVTAKCDKSNFPDFKAGQFMLVSVPSRPNSTVTTQKPFSIASSPDDVCTIQFLIGNSSSSGSNYFYQSIKTNDSITMNGPWGNFYLRAGKKPAILIAGGTGVAPIRSMLRYVKNHPMESKPLHFFFGAQSEYNIFYEDEFQSLVENIPTLKFYPCAQAVSKNWTGYKGDVLAAVKSSFSLEDIKKSQIYLCGRPGLIDSALEFFTECEVDKLDIFYDKIG